MITQYDAVIDKLTVILKDSGIQVISTVSAARNGEGTPSWPTKGATPFLVLYETAEDAVARGIWKGDLPSHVLARWILNAEVLLSKHRERRRQFTLVSIGAVLMEPENFLVELSRRFDRRDFPCDQLVPIGPVWPGWQGLLARQIVSGEPIAMRLNDELEAAALPLSARFYDPDAAVSELNAIQLDREQLSAQLEKLRTQVTVDQTEKEKADSELLRVAKAEAEARQSDLEIEHKLLRDQIMHLQHAVQDGVSALTDQQREFSATKLALVAAQDRVDGLEATLKGLTTQAARYRAELDELTGSKQRLVTEFSKLMDRILNGKQLTRWPRRWRRAQQIGIVRDCGVVDPKWYLQHHQDVAQAGAEPFRHYIDYGAKEGRPPNEGFI